MLFCQKIKDGDCDEDATEDNLVETDHVISIHTERSGCPYECSPAGDDTLSSLICGSDGKTYPDMCHLLHNACVTASHLKMIHEGTDLRINLLGFKPQLNLGSCDEMKSVAEHATLELGPELNSETHFTLSYIESEDKQVTW